MKRRDFLAAGALAGSLALPKATAEQDPKNDANKDDEKKKDEHAPKDIDLLTDLVRQRLVRQRFGELLSEEQFAEVRRQIAGNLRAALVLSTYPLRNGDEPVLAPSSIYRLEQSR